MVLRGFGFGLRLDGDFADHATGTLGAAGVEDAVVGVLARSREGQLVDIAEQAELATDFRRDAEKAGIVVSGAVKALLAGRHEGLVVLDELGRPVGLGLNQRVFRLVRATEEGDRVWLAGGLQSPAD